MSDKANPLLISPAARDALQTWLEHQSALKDAAENTIIAYRGDVTEFLTFMTLHKGDTQGLGALAKITISDMRAWMASTRSGPAAQGRPQDRCGVTTSYDAVNRLRSSSGA